MIKIDRDFGNHLAQVSILISSDDAGVATDLLRAMERAAIEAMDGILAQAYPTDYYDYKGFE